MKSQYIMETLAGILNNDEGKKSDRRSFIGKGLILVTTGGVGGLLTACKKGGEEGEKEVSPPEDLMQEHGVLKRVLLIYDTCRVRLMNKQSFSIEAVTNGAGIIRTFIEDYHEKQEENYIFPRFQKANQLIDLVQVLLEQHKVGRTITDQIMQLSKSYAA